MKSIFVKYKEQILYIFFGVLTTCVNLGMYWLLERVFAVPYLISSVIAQITSILFAYITNRLWVFESRVGGLRGIAAEMAKFFSCRAASLFIDLLLMYIGVDLTHINDKVMKLAANIIIIIVNYVFSKLLVFHSSGKAKP